MALSIFYSLNLRKSYDAEERMGQLLLAARDIAHGSSISVGKLNILSGQDCANAQATMNENFSFARTVCQPSGAERRTGLGTIPLAAMYFRISEQKDTGFDLGIAQYAPDAKLKIHSGNNRTRPYDGGWYYWNFVDEITKSEVDLLIKLLAMARELRFETTFNSESELFDAP